MKLGRPAKLTPAQIAEIRAVARARAAIPSNAELAARLGVNRRTMDYWLADERAQIRAEKAELERQMPRNIIDSTQRIQT